jgi:hypothetical protein
LRPDRVGGGQRRIALGFHRSLNLRGGAAPAVDVLNEALLRGSRR